MHGIDPNTKNVSGKSSMTTNWNFAKAWPQQISSWILLAEQISSTCHQWWQHMPALYQQAVFRVYTRVPTTSGYKNKH